jgi:hypothetical protein
MSNREHVRAVACKLIYDRVRKPASRYRAHVPCLRAAEIRIRADESNEPFDFFEKLAAEARCLAFVEDGGVSEFGAGERMEAGPHPPMRRLASVKASVADTGCTVPDCSSAARR